MIILLLLASDPKSIIAQVATQVHPSYQADRPGAPLTRSQLETRVSLSVQDSTLKYVLKTLGAQAHLQVALDNGAPIMNKRVSLSVTNMPVLEAMAIVLQGTGLVAKLSSEGTTIMIGSPVRSEAHVSNTGIIAGRVIDSLTKKGIAGAAVVLLGSKQATITDATGKFFFPKVPTGVQSISVRLLGYTSRSVNVTVDSGVTASVVVVLYGASTHLTEVVTTASGSQRRLEVSNDIVRIDAEKIIQAAPVRSVSDLLVAAQVPGAVFTRTSGEPGAPTRIRFGGPGSISQNNDPVVIVDGVWIQSNFSTSDVQRQLYNGGSGGGLLASRLDDIDPSTIETIEIVRGPAAASMYGPDAANGVIVITTKRGRPGTSRWDVRMYRDWTHPVGKKPSTYQAYGHGVGSSAPVSCSLLAATAGQCVQDSVVVFDPSASLLTPEGDGFTKGLSMGVSGGVALFTYSLTGSFQDQQGIRQLPSADRIRLRQLDVALPSQLRTPSVMRDRSLSVLVTMTPRPGLDVTLTMQGSQKNSREAQLQLTLATGALLGPYDTLMTLDQNIRISPSQGLASTIRGLGSLAADWRPRPWWSGKVTVGLDRGFVHEKDVATDLRCMDGQCLTGDSREAYADKDIAIYSARAQSTFLPSLGWAARFLSFRPGVSFDLRREVRGNRVFSRFVPGVGGGGSTTTAGSMSDGPTTALAGLGLNAYVSLFNRISFAPGVRRDFGSSKNFHNNAKSYPRFGTSWLVSDESFFPKTVFVTSLRLRAAMGVASVQPDLTALRGRYVAGATIVDGRTVPTYRLTAIGNTVLEPERSFEIESGLDADLLGGRMALTLTHSNKRNKNVLINRTLAPSAGGAGLRQENVAFIRNRRTDVQVQTRVLDRDGVRLNFDAYTSFIDNRIVELGDRVSPFGESEQRYVPGYPVGGLWLRPILAINDANQDGILTPNEIVMGDSLEYMGTAQPLRSAGFMFSLALMSRLTVTARMDFKGAYMQNRSVSIADMQGFWDPASSLAAQALVRAIDAGTGLERSSDRQTVSEARWQSASITYDLPSDLARKMKARMIQLSLQGNNLGLWTNYRGRDPGVNSFPVGEQTRDNGAVIPVPRSFTMQVRLTF